MDSNLEKVIEDVKIKFLSLPDPDDRYNYLIELGRQSPLYPKELRTASRIVPGCQSVLYLDASLRDGNVFFSAHSDALISQGLAALLVSIYSGQTPQIILLNPPLFLQEIGLFTSLSPNRSNGLASIYIRMKQEALKYLNQL